MFKPAIIRGLMTFKCYDVSFGKAELSLFSVADCMKAQKLAKSTVALLKTLESAIIIYCFRVYIY
jgi:hypothetical protein